MFGIPGWILRQLADFIAFHDYEPWDKAARQFLTEAQVEEDCIVCNTKANYENA
jgi:hypothetical protein